MPDAVPTTPPAPSETRAHPVESASPTASMLHRGQRDVQEPRRGFFGRLADRLTRADDELEADELQGEAERVGATPICDLPNRERAHVCGTIRSVTLRPRADVPALVVEIYDGSRPLHLVWLGRREIAGIEPGVMLRATGRVSYYRGVATIFNPFYEIVPKGA